MTTNCCCCHNFRVIFVDQRFRKLTSTSSPLTRTHFRVSPVTVTLNPFLGMSRPTSTLPFWVWKTAWDSDSGIEVMSRWTGEWDTFPTFTCFLMPVCQCLCLLSIRRNVLSLSVRVFAHSRVCGSGWYAESLGEGGALLVDEIRDPTSFFFSNENWCSQWQFSS